MEAWWGDEGEGRSLMILLHASLPLTPHFPPSPAPAICQSPSAFMFGLSWGCSRFDSLVKTVNGCSHYITCLILLPSVMFITWRANCHTSEEIFFSPSLSLSHTQAFTLIYYLQTHSLIIFIRKHGLIHTHYTVDSHAHSKKWNNI